MTYSPLAVANFFIEQSEDEGVQHLKIQKLVYCAQGWWLHYRGLDTPLIDEDFQTFKSGPVCVSLYSFFKPYGWGYITKQQSLTPVEDPPQVTDEQDRKILQWVWDRYVDMDGRYMTSLTRRIGSPWFNIVKANGGKPDVSMKISKEAMKAEFDEIASDFNGRTQISQAN